MAGITIPLIVTGDAAIDAAVSKLARLDQAINKMAESQKRATSQSAQPLALEKPRLSRNQTEELLRLNKELEGVQNKQHFTLALLLKDLREYDKEMSKAASNARIEMHGREAGIKAVEKQAKAYQTVTAELAKFNAETFRQTERAKAALYAKQTPAKAEADLLRSQADTRQESRNLKDPAYIANEQRKIANAATKEAILLESKLTAEATKLTAAEKASNQALAASNEIRKVNTKAKQDALTADAREAASLAELNRQIASSVSSERIAAANKKIINDARVAAATSAEREKAALAALNLQIANSTSPERIAAERKKLAARTTLDAALAADREAAALAKLRTELATTDVKERERIKLLQELARAQAALAAQQGNAGAVKQTVAAKEQARAERELALLLARKSAAIAPLIAQIKKLREEEDKATRSTQQFSVKLHLARQAAAALRSSLYGLGTSFGMFTSSTVLTAASVYAVMSAIRLAVREAIQYEKALAALGAMSSQATAASSKYAEDLRQLNAAVSEAANSTQFSMAETATAMKQLALAGLDAQQSIEAVPSALALATIGAMDFAQAAEIATNVMMGMGLTVQDLPVVVDTLAKAATESNANVQELGNALSYAAPLAASFGVSLGYTTAAMEVLANAGIKGSRAGTGMRRVFISLFTPTEKITEAVRLFGVTLGKVNEEALGMESLDAFAGKLIEAGDGAEEAQRMLEEFYVATAGGSRNLQLLREAVGVYALPAMTQLVRSVGLGKKSIQELAKGLADVEGSSAQQMTKMMDNLATVWDEVKASASVSATKLYDTQKSGLREMLEVVRDIARALGDSEEPAQALVKAVIAVGEAVWTVVKVLLAYKAAVISIGALTAIWGMAATAVTAVGSVLGSILTTLKLISTYGAGSGIMSALALGGGAGLAALLPVIGQILVLVGLVGAGIWAWSEYGDDVVKALEPVSDAANTLSNVVETARAEMESNYKALIQGGGLLQLYKDRTDLELQMIDLVKSDTSEVYRLAKAYEEVQGKISDAHKQLKEFSGSSMTLYIASLRTNVGSNKRLEAEQEAEVARLRGARDSANRQSEDASRAAYRAAADALAVTKAQNAADAERLEGTIALQRVLRLGTGIEQLRESLALMRQVNEETVGINQAIRDQEELIERKKGAHTEADLAELRGLQARAKILKEQLESYQALIDTSGRGGALELEKALKVEEKAAKEMRKEMELLKGTELDRASAALYAAKQARDAAAEQVHATQTRRDEFVNAERAIRDELDSTADKLSSTGLEIQARYGAVQGLREIAIAENLAAYVAQLKAERALVEAEEKYQTERSSAAAGGDKAAAGRDKDANAEAKLIKSAAELHEAHLTLIKDLADLKGGFEDLTEKALARGIEFYEKLTAAGKKYSETIQVIRHSGAQLPGVGPISGGYIAPGQGVGAGSGTGTVLGAGSVNIPRRSQMDQSFVAGLEQFIRAGKALGHAITVGDTFRTGAEQADLFRRKPNLAAPPGSSRHERGTAADLAFADAQSQRWAHESAAQYGLDFPMADRRPGKKYEPWHIQQAGGGGSLAERNRDLTSENKSMLELKQTVESLTDAQRAEAEAAQARFTIAGHIESRRVLEIASYQELEKRAGELQRAEALLAKTTGADLPLAVDAAKRAQEAYSAELERNNQLHEAQLMWEEEGLRYYDLTALTVERNAKEIQVLTDKYVDGSAAMRDFKVAQAELNYLLEKGAIDWDQYDLAMSRNKKTLAAAQGNYEKFFADLTYDSDNFRDIATQGFTDLRDTTADIFSSIGADGKLQLSSIWEAGEEGFKKFLGNLRDAAAKFAADKVISSLFDPKSGLVSGAAGWAMSFITSFFATGGAVQAGLPHGVYSRPTLFPMQTPGFHPYASGVGLLGEAGPEAILPLTRTSGGDLGVRATSQQPVVNVTVKNLPGQSAKTSQDDEGNITIEILEARLASRVMNGSSPLPRAMENSYGLRRT